MSITTNTERMNTFNQIYAFFFLLTFFFKNESWILSNLLALVRPKRIALEACEDEKKAHNRMKESEYESKLTELIFT